MGCHTGVSTGREHMLAAFRNRRASDDLQRLGMGDVDDLKSAGGIRNEDMIARQGDTPGLPKRCDHADLVRRVRIGNVESMKAARPRDESQTVLHRGTSVVGAEFQAPGQSQVVIVGDPFGAGDRRQE